MNESYKSLPAVNLLKQIFESFDLRLDTRSLSVMRIGMGLVMLVSLLEIWPDFVPFFTDFGIVANSLVPWNLFSIVPLPLFNHLLFLMLAIAAFLFTLGYFTRFCGTVASVLYLCLFLRNPYIINISDFFISTMVIWLSILPSNLHLSLDSEKKAHLIKISKYYNAAFLFQLFLFYILFVVRSGLLSAQTIWYAKNQILVEQSNTYLGELAMNTPGFVFNIVSVIVIFAILVVPPAILFSKNIKFKSKMILIGIIFATFLGIFKNLGLLPVAIVVVILGLLPAEFWETPRIRITIADRAALQSTAPAKNIIIVFLVINLFLFLSFTKAPQVIKPYRPALWWQTVLGFRPNGEFVNLTNNAMPFSKQKPVSFTEGVLNYRWRSLGESLNHVKNPSVIQNYLAPFCWQSKNLVFIQLLNYEQEIVRGGLRDNIAQKLLGQRSCY